MPASKQQQTKRDSHPPDPRPHRPDDEPRCGPAIVRVGARACHFALPGSQGEEDFIASGAVVNAGIAFDGERMASRIVARPLCGGFSLFTRETITSDPYDPGP